MTTRLLSDVGGSRNTGRYGTSTLGLGAMPYANVQAQWDVADWPCFLRYIAKWLPQIRRRVHR